MKVLGTISLAIGLWQIMPFVLTFVLSGFDPSFARDPFVSGVFADGTVFAAVGVGLLLLERVLCWHKEKRRETQMTAPHTPLELYQTELRGLPEYEESLFPKDLAQARQGDDEARRRILGSGLKTAFQLALQIAEEKSRADPSEILELIEEANVGLTQAFQSFQGGTAVEFLDHAAQKIRTRLHRYTNKA